VRIIHDRDRLILRGATFADNGVGMRVQSGSIESWSNLDPFTFIKAGADIFCCIIGGGARFARIAALPQMDERFITGIAATFTASGRMRTVVGGGVEWIHVTITHGGTAGVYHVHSQAVDILSSSSSSSSDEPPPRVPRIPRTRRNPAAAYRVQL
jgi:hypothetical protein